MTSIRRQFSHFNLPRNLSFEPYDMRYTVDFILSQYHRLTTLSFFGPNDQQVTGVREAVSYRMRESDMIRWTMFLAMKTLAAILDGANTTKLEGHIRWIARFEQQLDGLDSNDLGRLVGTLELAFLKSKIVHRPNTYQEVQNLAPKFLQIAFADSTLWPDSGRFPTSVSLTRILSSHRHELVHFVMLDSLCSLAYALPQAIEYDTSFSPINIGVHLMEWIHGCPTELQHALVEINARCHGRARAQPERDWRFIERQIKSWKPKVWSTLEEDSWKTVARLAVQESWRHTMLIYIYMGVCGVSSDDERVQESVHQVFRLIETAKDSYTPLVSIYIPVQYIVAGACARTEKHREIARERLGATLKDTIWLLNAADFVPVLDHLWHGAAANGQAIRWSDYAYSRQVALPIPVDSIHLG